MDVLGFGVKGRKEKQTSRRVKEAWCDKCGKRVSIKSQNTEGTIIRIVPCKHCLNK